MADQQKDSNKRETNEELEIETYVESELGEEQEGIAVNLLCPGPIST